MTRVRRPSVYGGYGWRPQLPDRRDFVRNLDAAALPARVDLRSLMPPVYDQGNLGSCTANAIAGAIEYDQMKQKKLSFAPSRLFIYYNERAIEGDVSKDAGAQIRDGIKSVASKGAPPETDWPYVESEFAVTPPAKAYGDAAKDLVGYYYTVPQTIDQMKASLAAGYPFVFGFTVYESFESNAVASSGIMPMPAENEETLGGHAVMAVGYDDASSMIIVRNSWGTSWGQAGYFEMPYAYITDANLASDFWVVRSVTE
jgi:C1A family cysteine protease